MERRIEVVTLKVKDLKFGFGNPRKITRKKKDELRKSLETHGDFGLFLVDEDNNVIAGNQRAQVLPPDAEILCKRLVGYSDAEKRAINIKDNVHAGELDLELLAEWTADLNIDLGIDLDGQDVEERNLKDMELIRYEKYDYVLIACKSELDYNDLVRKLGIEGRKVKVCKSRKIKARAIWYDQIKCQIVEQKEETT